jgi:hypothetical protein
MSTPPTDCRAVFARLGTGAFVDDDRTAEPSLMLRDAVQDGPNPMLQDGVHGGLEPTGPLGV